MKATGNMITLCRFDYDSKNDRYELSYQGNDVIQIVGVGGSAMKDLFGTHTISTQLERSIGIAIAEYLSLKNIESPKKSPVFIQSEIDVGKVSNALKIDADMKEFCQKYLCG